LSSHFGKVDVTPPGKPGSNPRRSCPPDVLHPNSVFAVVLVALTAGLEVIGNIDGRGADGRRPLN
jgi:hypothetical protein